MVDGGSDGSRSLPMYQQHRYFAAKKQDLFDEEEEEVAEELADGAESTDANSRVGYVYFDQEEEAEEVVRQLNPFRTVPLSKPLLDRSKRRTLERELFRARLLSSRALISRFRSAQVEQQAEARATAATVRRAAREQRRQAKESADGKSPKLVKTAPFSGFGGTPRQLKLEHRYLATTYNRLTELRMNTPDISLDEAIAETEPTFAQYVPPETRAYPFIRQYMHDFLLHPQHMLNYQDNLTITEREKMKSQLFNRTLWAFGQQAAVRQSISSASKSLLDAGFSPSDLRLPDSLPDLSATRLFRSAEFQEQWKPPSEVDHVSHFFGTERPEDELIMERSSSMTKQKPGLDAELETIMTQPSLSTVNSFFYPDAGSSDDEYDFDNPTAIGPSHEPQIEFEEDLEDIYTSLEGDGDFDYYFPYNKNPDDGGDLPDDDDDDDENYDASRIQEQMKIRDRARGAKEDRKGSKKFAGPAGAAGAEEEEEDDGLDADAQEMAVPLWELRKSGLLKEPLALTPDQRRMLLNNIDHLDRATKPLPTRLEVALASIKDPVLLQQYRDIITSTTLLEFDRAAARIALKSLPPAAESQLHISRRSLAAAETLADPKRSRLLTLPQRVELLLQRDGFDFRDFDLLEEVLQRNDAGDPKCQLDEEEELRYSLLKEFLAIQVLAESNTTTTFGDNNLPDILRAAIDPSLPLAQIAPALLKIHNTVSVLPTNNHHVAMRLYSAFVPILDKIEEVISNQKIDIFGGLPPLHEHFPIGSFRVDEIYGDLDYPTIRSPEEFLGFCATENSADAHCEWDRWIYHATASFKKANPVVGELLVHHPTRRRLNSLLRFALPLFLGAKVTPPGEGKHASLGLIYDVAIGLQRVPREIHEHMNRVIKDTLEERFPSSQTLLSDAFHSIATTQAPSGLTQTKGEATLEARAVREFVDRMVAAVKQEIKDRDSELAKRAIRTLDFLESLQKEMTSDGDRKLLESLILLHLHLFQVSHEAERMLGQRDQQLSERRLEELLSQPNTTVYSGYLKLIEDWMVEQTAAYLPTPWNPAPKHHRPRLSDYGFSVSTVEYVEPLGNKLHRKRLAFSQRKVSFLFDVATLSLPKAVEQRLAALSGSRYDANTRTLRIVADRYPKPHLNFRHAVQMTRKLLTEARKADPSFVPLDDEAVPLDSLISVAPETPSGPLLPAEYYQGTLNSLSAAEIEAIKDVEEKWRLKQLAHEYVLFRIHPTLKNRLAKEKGTA